MRHGKFGWILGLWTPWVAFWLFLGIRTVILLGANPHPFLPAMNYTGAMLRAVAYWALGALAAHLFLGLFLGMCTFLALLVGSPQRSREGHLGFQRGMWAGFGTVLLFHGLLFLEVPGALGSFPLLKRIPMALALVVFFAAAWGCLSKALRGPEVRALSFRIAGVFALCFCIVRIPHDILRRFAPHPAPLAATERRLLVFGVDGLRQSSAERAMPHWKAPGGATPVVAAPATRIGWNLLLGADPNEMIFSSVVPFRSEWTKKHSLGLLEEAQRRNIRSSFLIDDCTTLSFGLTSAPFNEVKEPFGGWKHFFTVGAGFAWPAYSWVENYISPVESTNPWSEPRYFLNDVERALERSHWVSTHTCQLHAPFFLRRRELQALRPWAWLSHSARSYQPYHTLEQLQRDQISRAGKRADPLYQYEVRVAQLLREIEPRILAWEKSYPALSGVFTSDHGEDHVEVRGDDGTLLTRFTGIHGFALEPETLKIPLHPFGRSQSRLSAGDVYSWFHLRDDIQAWIHAEGPLNLSSSNKTPWIVRWPYMRAVHILGELPTSSGESQSSAFMTAGKMVARVTLLEDGTWFADDIPPEQRNSFLCYALLQGDHTTTFIPTGTSSWTRIEWDEYQMLGSRVVDREQLHRELEDAKASRPIALLPYTRHPGPMGERSSAR